MIMKNVLLLTPRNLVHQSMASCYKDAFDHVSKYNAFFSEEINKPLLKSGRFQWSKVFNLFNPFLIFNLIRSIFSVKPEVVFIFNLELNFIWVFVARFVFWRKYKVVYLCHEPKLNNDFQFSLVKNLFNSLFQMLSNVVVYPSEQSMKQGKLLSYNSNSINGHLTFKARHNFKRNPTKTELLFFGAMDDNKNPSFINLLDKLNLGSNLGFSLSRVGIDITSSPIDYSSNIVRVDGFVSDSIKEQFFSNVGFIVLPYNTIRQSGVLAEAFSYGIPVIATNIEGFSPYFKNGYNGLELDVLDENKVLDLLYRVKGMTYTEYFSFCENATKTYEQYFSISSLSLFLENTVLPAAEES